MKLIIAESAAARTPRKAARPSPSAVKKAKAVLDKQAKVDANNARAARAESTKALKEKIAEKKALAKKFEAEFKKKLTAATQAKDKADAASAKAADRIKALNEQRNARMLKLNGDVAALTVKINKIK